MKLLHIADLHIGKIVNEFSMLEDQEAVLAEIVQLACDHRVDGILLAGDIYDRAVPSGDAVLVFDAFLTALVQNGIAVYLISGNHDSAQRISYGESLLTEQHITIAGVYRGQVKTVQLQDDYGKLEIVLLPFLRPAQAEASTSDEAARKVLSSFWEKERADGDDDSVRRILMAHCFVTDAGREPALCDSETMIHVGGIDNVDAAAFDGFDYVALGHIHRPQQIGSRNMYYAGSILPYSFSEAGQEKCAMLIDLKEKGNVHITRLPLTAGRKMRKIEGTLQELLFADESRVGNRDDYLQAVLTDEHDLIDPMGQLRSVYPHMMQVVRKERVLQAEDEQRMDISSRKQDPLQLAEDFCTYVSGEELSEEQRHLLIDMLKEAEETS